MKNKKGVPDMIHQYRNNGYNIVMDVYSGSVHVVDDVCYDVIAKIERIRDRTNCRIIKRNRCKKNGFCSRWEINTKRQTSKMHCQT